MKVSITAVSANRQMTKTLVRASGRLLRLREAFAHLNPPDAPFDTLQFVLTDGPGDYVHLQGTQDGDRLFQVQVGARELPCGPGRERDFVEGLARTLHAAVARLPVSDCTIREMRAAMERASIEPGAPPNVGPATPSGNS